MYDSAHFREHLPAPVAKFLDLLVDAEADSMTGLSMCSSNSRS
jgi:hypothetical protein